MMEKLKLVALAWLAAYLILMSLFSFSDTS
jgi:hypothetical protein